MESRTTRGIQAKHAKRIRIILARLSAATSPKDMNFPGLVLHELAGQRKGIWSGEYLETGGLRLALMELMRMMSISRTTADENA